MIRARARRPFKEFIDQDYLSKLTSEQQQWLKEFNLAYYGETACEGWDEKATLEANSRRNRARRDAYAKFERTQRDHERYAKSKTTIYKDEDSHE